ncbi:sodium/solute symporter [bacterium]|nr:sodium/solute symporter [bacterium]MBU1072513.1 sodium/solute symporter [bacterium]MBU1676538.1 sodium/solute symporter [bacterium]
MLDALVILGYFAVVMVVAVRARLRHDATSEQYFVGDRNLGWWSIAASTIATNLHAGHFLAVIGSAYAFGLAQANFELNAVLGLVVAAFVFVPLYLRERVVTITQFFERRFGARVATTYSLLMMFLYGTLYLGAVLFWGGYSLEILYGDGLQAAVGGTPALRICAMIVLLGAFSATYTYFGGLGAVVRTDIVQFVLLLGGGLTVTLLAVGELGGFGELYAQVGDRMHLHLPNSHKQLPWLGIVAMHMLNLQYWGCNQVILQRSLAARSLRDAQIGLLVGGAFKFVTAAMLVLPGIALVGILGEENALVDPDQAYLRVVELLLSPGVKGLVLCGLFASLMSSVDSIFNSISTLWSVDIYKRWLRPDAADAQVVSTGRRAILVTLAIGVLFGFAFAYVKLANPEFPLDPFFKKTSYFIKNGFVVLIASAVFLAGPSRRLVWAALVLTIPITIALNLVFAGTPYLILTSVIIVSAFLVVAVPTIARNGWRPGGERLIKVASRGIGWFGAALGVLLAVAHVVFH